MGMDIGSTEDENDGNIQQLKEKSYEHGQTSKL